MAESDRDVYLKSLQKSGKFKLSDGAPNIINWMVLDKEGNAIGKVMDLVIDENVDKIRYVVIEPADGLEGWLIIPVGVLGFHRASSTVGLAMLNKRNLDKYPLSGDVVPSQDDERRILGFYRESNMVRSIRESQRKSDISYDELQELKAQELDKRFHSFRKKANKLRSDEGEKVGPQINTDVDQNRIKSDRVTERDASQHRHKVDFPPDKKNDNSFYNHPFFDERSYYQA